MSHAGVVAHGTTPAQCNSSDAVKGGSHASRSRRVALQALPLLRGAPPAALEAAADLFQRHTVTCGEVLALAGRPLERVSILRSGELAALPAGSDAIADAGGAGVVGTQALQVRRTACHRKFGL